MGDGHMSAWRGLLTGMFIPCVMFAGFKILDAERSTGQFLLMVLAVVGFSLMFTAIRILDYMQGKAHGRKERS